MAKQPQYRGGLCRAAVERLSNEPEFAEVREAVPIEALDAIEHSGALSWVDARHLDALNLAYLASVGEERYVRFWEGHPASSRGSNLLGPLIAGAIRIFGSDAAGLLTWVGRAWEATTRGYGTVHATRSEREVHLVHRDIPPSGRLPPVVFSQVGALLGVAKLVDWHATVDVDRSALVETGTYQLNARVEPAVRAKLG